jgi:hypothetical protein
MKTPASFALDTSMSWGTVIVVAVLALLIALRAKSGG